MKSYWTYVVAASVVFVLTSVGVAEESVVNDGGLGKVKQNTDHALGALVAPSIVAGATNSSINPVNRFGANNTTLQCSFTDNDQPGIGAFTVTFRIREPNNVSELTLVSNLGHGVGGMTITDNGLGNYTARYTYDPDAAQTLGLYDLYCEVSDGVDTTVDDYANNPDEMEIVDIPANSPPVLVAGGTAVSPASIDRVGGATTTFSATVGDVDAPGNGAFYVRFKVRSPFNESVYIVADGLQHGQGGLTITDDGGGLYTASMAWDPADNYALGSYDLYCDVYDGSDSDTDYFDDNADELLLTNGGANSPPVVPSDNTFASPAGVERIGVNPTTLSATFADADLPEINAFAVTFKLRDTNNVTEIVLANNVGHGVSGVTITDDGGGIYTASINWDPSDVQTLGFYDLYFHVTDGADISYDGYQNNLDELQVLDAVSNNPPTLVAGNTSVVPTSVNRIGAGFTMIKADFSDADIPGPGAFTVTFVVRDPALGEVSLTTDASHGQQGVRIVNKGDGNYEAAVLWDPDVAQPTGTYDLYFSVTDNKLATASDFYGDNLDELTVTSAAILGDGHLLRRSNDASLCGGPNSACHNMWDHQGNDCLTCHTPHGTTNIYLVNDTIQTPNSGPREVVFKTLGIGDPYNDPDPTVGDPASGVMADDADGVFTGVCEVCHTSTNHHRNDGSHPPPEHNNAQNCVGCHIHANGFAGGESGGGESCGCHTEIFNTMDSSAVGHHHILANIDADYSPGASGTFTIKNCLTCHVDHDIFRPDLNTGIGQRGKNLRVDWAIDPVPGDNTVLSNSDYLSTGAGGVCLSCHSGPSCLGCHSAHKTSSDPLPKATSSFTHTFIPKTDFDAATTGHNYDVPSTYTSDGSVFNANCTKCHNDNKTKLYQNSTYTISTHSSDYSKLLNPLGVGTPGDPLEEDFCYQCHSTTSNPNAGSNLDYFGVKAMAGSGPMEIEGDMGLTSTHPVSSYSGIHQMNEDPATMTRHVECEDCHNVHAATADQPPSPALSGALYGVRGIDVFGNTIDPVVRDYQVCFKCHADNPGTTQLVTRQFNNGGNTRLEFDTASVSYHPVVGEGKNNNSPSLIGGWTETSVMTCDDCHASSGGAADGPHGSSFSPILKLRYDTGDTLAESPARYALCYSCHDRNSILGDQSFGKHNKHIRGQDTPCSVCHDAHGSTGQAHLVNFDTNVCTPVAGGLQFIDDGDFTGQCYVDCHGKKHNPKSY